MSTAQSHITRTETVATVLRDEILSGQYRTWERLPSERDLCERFGVSRGAVREALKQLQQLGIASIQPGGARVAPIEDCTLDVLGPLLDLNDAPDPKLVDEVMHMIGVLMREAAAAAIEKATPEEIEAAEEIIDGFLARADDPAGQFEALRKLADFYVTVADHLVLRLMVNGLKMSFLNRMAPRNPMVHLNTEDLDPTIQRIRMAVSERNPQELGVAMQEMNRQFRNGLRESLRLDGAGK